MENTCNCSPTKHNRDPSPQVRGFSNEVFHRATGVGFPTMWGMCKWSVRVLTSFLQLFCRFFDDAFGILEVIFDQSAHFEG